MIIKMGSSSFAGTHVLDDMTADRTPLSPDHGGRRRSDSVILQLSKSATKSTGSFKTPKDALPQTMSDSLAQPNGARVASAAERVVSPCPFWKRTIDIAGASFALIALLPLFLVVAAIIKCGSRGPLFFRQQRFGLYGRPFKVWKFRSLQVNEADSTQRTFMIELMDSEAMMVKRDPQLAIIPGGRLMRKLGIDELPQLFNVLRGEMSLVGPRPHVVPYEEYPEWQRPRFDVLPGITGLWQVSGKEQTTFSMMMQMDIDYIQRRSFWLDCKIMLQTLPAVLRN
jgi:lipopolysaccharide/colanic/teichoic acid biosynthesis glycosyltransferase